MNIVGDTIDQILHSGGIERDGVVVDRYAIVLSSGRCIALTELGVVPTDPGGLAVDVEFTRQFSGLRIDAVVESDNWPVCVLRLSNGRALSMGSPHPYYWGLQEVEGLQE